MVRGSLRKVPSHIPFSRILASTDFDPLDIIVRTSILWLLILYIEYLIHLCGAGLGLFWILNSFWWPSLWNPMESNSGQIRLNFECTFCKSFVGKMLKRNTILRLAFLNLKSWMKKKSWIVKPFIIHCSTTLLNELRFWHHHYWSDWMIKHWKCVCVFVCVCVRHWERERHRQTES